jgi:hypothetical protein
LPAERLIEIPSRGCSHLFFATNNNSNASLAATFRDRTVLNCPFLSSLALFGRVSLFIYYRYRPISLFLLKNMKNPACGEFCRIACDESAISAFGGAYQTTCSKQAYPLSL